VSLVLGGVEVMGGRRTSHPPILDGAGILYVLDGSHSRSEAFLAELEILQWTGQPRMALINDKKNEPNASSIEEWKKILNQYFSLVRYFNAQESKFEDRINLLNLLKNLSEDWSTTIDEAIVALVKDREGRISTAAHQTAKYLIKSTTLTMEKTIPEEDSPKEHAKAIEEEYHNVLRQAELEYKKEISELFKHRRLNVRSTDYSKPIFEQDLFAEEVWQGLGLSTSTLVVIGVISGAVVGGLIDFSVGLTSFLTGAVIGAVAGGASAWMYSSPLMNATEENIREGINKIRQRKKILIGPHKNPNFPWILLDRALLFYSSVSQRAHAKRNDLDLTSQTSQEKIGIVEKLPLTQKRELGDIFKKATSSPENAKEELSKILLSLLKQNSFS
jgi:hypothetical protein